MGSSKASKSEQSAAESRANAERAAADANLAAAKAAEQKLIQAGQTARSQMLETGKPTTEETGRLQRYTTKATAPAESLLTESGPISQAIAKRIQERSETPGLDYSTQSEAFAEGVSKPLWRALKQRGIAPPPGSEGGGLGTEQYMKGAAPALAELRSNAINQDITRGQQYGDTARSYQNIYTNLESALAEAIRNRAYESGMQGALAEQQGVSQGAPYGYQGTVARGTGMAEAERINQEEVQRRRDRQRAEQEAIGQALFSFIPRIEDNKLSWGPQYPTTKKTETKTEPSMSAALQKRIYGRSSA